MNNATSYSKSTVIFAAFLLLVLASTQALADNDRTIRLAIEKAAADTPKLQGTDVRFAVKGGSIVLFGSVRLYLHKMLYEQIAWRVTGVAEVDNEIRIEPQMPLPDVEIARKIREIAKLYVQFHESGMKVTVARGAVILSATFHHSQDVIFLKKNVAEIEGVIAIDIAATFRV